MQPRIPEPELMDDAEQASAYAAADFEEPNQRFIDTWFELFGAPTGAMLDIGCGPGDIVLRFARRFPGVLIDGLDGAESMLLHGRQALERAPELAPRVRFLHAMLPAEALSEQGYDAVISNSLLHHLHEPQLLWECVRRVGRPGAPVLVMDLFRPESSRAAAGIVDTYAADEPEVLRRDFYNSLLAAFTVDEVRDQLQSAGLGMLRVSQVSDRHLIVNGRLPMAHAD